MCAAFGQVIVPGLCTDEYVPDGTAAPRPVSVLLYQSEVIPGVGARGACSLLGASRGDCATDVLRMLLDLRELALAEGLPVLSVSAA